MSGRCRSNSQSLTSSLHEFFVFIVIYSPQTCLGLVRLSKHFGDSGFYGLTHWRRGQQTQFAENPADALRGLRSTGKPIANALRVGSDLFYVVLVRDGVVGANLYRKCETTTTVTD